METGNSRQPSAPGKDYPLYYGENSLSARFHDMLASVDPLIRGDIDFYASQIPPGSEILELGCGAGRVALKLVARGFDVTGSDLAPAMLAIADARRERLAPEDAARVRFLHGDMAALDLGRLFDAVLIPFFGFNHLSGPQQRQSAMHVIARHLRARGKAFMQVLTPEQLDGPLPDNQRQIRIQFDHGNRIFRWRALSRVADPNQRRAVTTVEHSVFDKNNRLIARSTELLAYSWFDDAEIERAAARAQLTLLGTEARFQDQDTDQPRKVYVLQR